MVKCWSSLCQSNQLPEMICKNPFLYCSRALMQNRICGTDPGTSLCKEGRAPPKEKEGAHLKGFPGGASGREPTCQCKRCKRPQFDPWVRKIPWRRAWQPTPVLSPGESHGQRSLAGYSPWGRRVGHGWSEWAHTQILEWNPPGWRSPACFCLHLIPSYSPPTSKAGLLCLDSV